MAFSTPTFSSQPPGLDSLEILIRAYEKITHPDMNSSYQVIFTQYDVPGLWNETPPRAPPCKVLSPEPVSELAVDYEFFASLAS